MKKNKIRKAVIPAAGFGTRFLPVTKAMPKEMLPIVDTPTLQFIVGECVASGVTEILIILGRNKKSIEDHFDRVLELEELLRRAGKKAELKLVCDIADMAHFHYVRQKEMLGSAYAVLEAEAFCAGEPFAVLFGDDVVYNTPDETPCLKQLIEAYETTGRSILGVQSVSPTEAEKYGIVMPGATKGRYTELLGIMEKPSKAEVGKMKTAPLASMGRYIFTPEIFDYIKEIKVRPNGEYYLTDAIEMQARATGVFAYDFIGRRYDVGDKQGFIEANIEYALRDASLKDGVMRYLKGLCNKE